MSSTAIICMLCQKTVPLEEDDPFSQFEEHTSDHHGVSFDAEFIYMASCLNSDERIQSIIEANTGPEESDRFTEKKKDIVNKCNVCDQTFTRPWCLKSHMKTDDPKRGKKCPNCQTVFFDEKLYKVHIEKQIKCDQCDLLICLDKPPSISSRHGQYHLPYM